MRLTAKSLKTGMWSALLLLAAVPAHATVIGVAVRGNGSSTTVGSTNSDGSINFYALMKGSGTYGVSGAGLSSDTCTIGSWSSTCTGGRLDMWLRFSPVTLGPNILTLHFTDLDLFGVNDPNYFLESVGIYDSTRALLAFVDSVADPEVASANYNTQTLSLALNATNNPYYTKLTFRTAFNQAPRGTYVNTIERMLATMSAVVPPASVPEPGTLSLLGAGLLLIGGVARRRRQ
jgi:hypothetical protein